MDEIFADQFLAIRAAGFSASICPDAVIQKEKPLLNVPTGATVVYRGWMLNATEYRRLVRAVESAGAKALTSLNAYLATHHLPNWYPRIKDFTPETQQLSADGDWEAELRRLGWTAFFVKDYVKSLKTSRGSIIHDPAEIGELVAEMKQFRGEIEGGLCVRRIEPFITDSERRFFVIDGRAFSSTGEPAPELVRQVASQIESPFFSVDVVRRADGVLRVVEIGDGQVSDIVGWSAQVFTEMWVTARAQPSNQ